jgi:membrane protease YdiL (CAAX protease family)
MRIFGYFGIFVAWNLVIGAAVLLLSPLNALLVVLVAYALVVHAYLTGPSASAPRRRALLRLRPLRGASLKWTLAAAPVLLVLTWGLQTVYLVLVPVPVETLDPLGPLMRTSYGSLLMTVLAVAMAPVVEEIFFRGLIQRSLELSLGAGWAILITSGAFAAVHALPWIFPLHLFLGAAFGFVVYASRSLWAGVILHATNNAAAMLGRAVEGEPLARTPTVWEIGPTPDLWTGLAVTLAASAAAIWVGRRLWWSSRPRSTFSSKAGGAERAAPAGFHLDSR